MNSFISTMVSRGFLQQSTFAVDDDIIPDGDISAYIGFDLTAPSLHVGSLIQLMVLRWLNRTGNKAYALLGGATTRIGDPSGKDESRKMLSGEEIAENLAGIQATIQQIVPDIEFITNDEWFSDEGPSLMGFLAEYGPHFTVNRMLTMESVKRRISREQPLTFLEFCYMLLQAVDFLEANDRHGINMQIGGSDQWGNIVNGVDIIRRKSNKTVNAFTTPLLLDKAGAKMGKSQGRPVWLDAKLTPVMDFFQYWRNCDDAQVDYFFQLFTELPEGDMRPDIPINDRKKRLAYEITKIVHGSDAATKALNDSVAIYENGDTSALAAAITKTGQVVLVDLLVEMGMASSKSDARRLIMGNAVSVNDIKVKNVAEIIDGDAVIRAGKQPPKKVNFK